MSKAKRRTVKDRALEVAKRLRKLPKYKTKLYLEAEARIEEAIKAYHNPAEKEISSLRVAGYVFNIPYSTLYGREKGARNLSHNGGHNTRLNEAQEMSLIWYIDIAIERGFPLRYDMITCAATRILEAMGLILSGNDRIGEK